MTYRVLLSVLMPLLLAACTDTPSRDELAKAVERHIVWQPWQVEGLQIAAESAIGQGYQYQLVADLSPKQDLYQTLFTLGDTRVVKLARAAGVEMAVKGVADAKDQGHGWEIVVAFDSDPFADQGEPRQQGDVLIDSPDYRSLLELSTQEVQKLEGEIKRLEERVNQVKLGHAELGAQVLRAREASSLTLQKWEDEFEARKDQIEDGLQGQIQNAQNTINDEQKKQLIDLNANFEQKFTKAEIDYQERRKALDKALVDNDRDYNRAVRDAHDSYKTDIGNIDTDKLSAEEYRSYTAARLAARDKALKQLQREHEAKREQFRGDKDRALAQYEENMTLLQQEKSATLNEARKVLGVQKEQAIGSYQQQLETAMAALEKEFTASREALVKEERELAERQRQMARELEQANADLVARKSRIENLLKGLSAARRPADSVSAN
ncbi:MAG: hypothetical protein II007_06440 [Gammaproteobacteria bacterium]|nr:hypothetical protein [Gammaproteobacteria bacterium]